MDFTFLNIQNGKKLLATSRSSNLLLALGITRAASDHVFRLKFRGEDKFPDVLYREF